VKILISVFLPFEGQRDKEARLARCQLLRPVILATQEAEIRRIAVESQSGQIDYETLSRKNPSQNRAGGGLKVLSSSPSTGEKNQKTRLLTMPRTGLKVFEMCFFRPFILYLCSHNITLCNNKSGTPLCLPIVPMGTVLFP
jgi:hypothetical protein